MDLRAVAFDIDGTLYPNRAVYMRLVPFAILHPRLLIGFGKVRNLIRASGEDEPFYDLQARLLGEYLRRDKASVRSELDEKVYKGWESIFRRVKLFPHLEDAIQAFRDAGLKIGVLSDFPVVNKLENLGLGGRFDCVLCSEDIGRLKPDPKPFLALAEGLGLSPGEILYVGNSLRYDVAGAKATGMRTAWFRGGRKKNAGADFIFNDYRQLRDYVLSLFHTGSNA